MDSESFRRLRGLSQADFAEEMGLSRKAKGYISRLESGAQRWPLHLALKYEKFSGGLVTAKSLCPEAGELLPANPAAAHP